MQLVDWSEDKPTGDGRARPARRRHHRERLPGRRDGPRSRRSRDDVRRFRQPMPPELTVSTELLTLFASRNLRSGSRADRETGLRATYASNDPVTLAGRARDELGRTPGAATGRSSGTPMSATSSRADRALRLGTRHRALRPAGRRRARLQRDGQHVAPPSTRRCARSSTSPSRRGASLALEETVRRRADLIIDAVCARGECDFATEIATALPIAVICDLMGVPEADRVEISRLSRASHPLCDGIFDDAYGAVRELITYGKELLRARLKSPSDDLTTVLATAEIDHERLDADDAGTFFELLVTAGYGHNRCRDRTRTHRPMRQPRSTRPVASRLQPR